MLVIIICQINGYKIRVRPRQVLILKNTPLLIEYQDVKNAIKLKFSSSRRVLDCYPIRVAMTNDINHIKSFLI